MDKSLQMAYDLKHTTKLATVQSLGRTYHFKDGYYQTLKSPKCDASLHMLVMARDGGQKLTPAKREQVIRNLEILTAVPEDSLNPEGIVCFKDCVVDVSSGQAFPHAPEHLVTTQLPYNFKATEDCPMWRKFLVDVTEGCECKQALLQEFAGYCLMKSCHLEKALFIIGRGSNGKSVFVDTLGKVFGRHNISSVNLEGLANPVHRCNILGKYLNIDSDLPRNAEKFEEAFRKIVSGEPMLFNEKFLPAFSAAPFCKLIYCLNEFPIIDDASNAFYRRMILIPFNVEFDGDKKDVNLKKKLEDELPGIFRWAMEGYNRVRAQGFSPDPFMAEYIHEIKTDNNPIIAFAEEELEFTNLETDRVTKRQLYDAYKTWAGKSGHKPPAFRKFNNRFYMEFQKRTEKDARTETDRVWPYVRFKGPAAQQQEVGWEE